MKRTKEWWSRLNKEERRRLIELERSFGSGPYGAGGYLPDDCSECDGCGQPQMGIGLCANCCKELSTLISKGDDQ